jgi:capsular polysaccharide transport system permease protein
LPDATKIITIAMSPLFMLSGVIFHVDAIPHPYRNWLLWNPILHAIEMIRDGFFSFHDQGNADPGYLTMTSFPVLFAGLFVFRVYRRRLTVQ